MVMVIGPTKKKSEARAEQRRRQADQAADRRDADAVVAE